MRGFEPVITHSWHGILHPGFRGYRFCTEESEHVAYFAESQTLLPYRNEQPRYHDSETVTL